MITYTKKNITKKKLKGWILRNKTQLGMGKNDFIASGNDCQKKCYFLHIRMYLYKIFRHNKNVVIETFLFSSYLFAAAAAAAFNSTALLKASSNLQPFFWFGLDY